MTIIDNTVLHSWNLLREYSVNIITKKNKKVDMRGDECINLMGGIFSPRVRMSNCHVVHLT